MENPSKQNRRRYLRYQLRHPYDHDLERHAQEVVGFVDYTTTANDQFKPTIIGLITDQSHSGCSLATIARPTIVEALSPKNEVILKVGPLAPMRAVVRWRKDWDEGLIKVGFEFLE